MEENNISIYTDGGARGNPGPAAFGFVIKKGKETIFSKGERIGNSTNNIAEYTAIIEALIWISDNKDKTGKFEKITILMDSLLACQQLKGLYRVKTPHIIELFIKVRNLEKRIGAHFSYQHIRRELNKEADSLVNAALDTPIL